MPDQAPADQTYVVENVTKGVTLATAIMVAGTSAARRRGLLDKDELEVGAGLWIAPCEAVHTLGMRWPIDVLFLGKDYTVRKISANLSPWRFSVCLSAHSVLELNAGATLANGTSPGDQLAFHPASKAFSNTDR